MPRSNWLLGGLILTGAAVSSSDFNAAAASIPGGRFHGVVTAFSKENSFTYLNPNLTDPIALSLCACAKCGSTTVYLALIEAVFGGPLRVKAAMEAMDARAGRKEGEPRNPDFLHFHWLWNAPGNLVTSPEVATVGTARLLTDAGFAGTHFHLWVHRDPVQRYVSSFKSKIRCCRNEAHNSSSRTPCYVDIPAELAAIKASDAPDYYSRPGGDGGDDGIYANHNPAVASLYQAGYRGAAGWTWDPEQKIAPPCLQLEEYVDALLHAFRAGAVAVASLEVHISPQDLSCPRFEGSSAYTTHTFSGGVGQITGVVKTAQGVFPQHSTRTIPKHFAKANAFAHRSSSLTTDGTAALGDAGLEALAAKFCELARPEYEHIAGVFLIDTCIDKARATLARGF